MLLNLLRNNCPAFSLFWFPQSPFFLENTVLFSVAGFLFFLFVADVAAKI